jgi:hypothetical protein
MEEGGVNDSGIQRLHKKPKATIHSCQRTLEEDLSCYSLTG